MINLPKNAIIIKIHTMFLTIHNSQEDCYSMIDTKKEQERAELHRVIWSIANDLRGSVDGWDFKQ